MSKVKIMQLKDENLPNSDPKKLLLYKQPIFHNDFHSIIRQCPRKNKKKLRIEALLADNSTNHSTIQHICIKI